MLDIQEGINNGFNNDIQFTDGMFEHASQVIEDAKEREAKDIEATTSETARTLLKAMGLITNAPTNHLTCSYSTIISPAFRRIALVREAYINNMIEA